MVMARNKKKQEQQEKEKQAKPFLRLIKLAKPYFWWYVLICILTVCMALTTVAVAEGLRRIINAATNKDMTGLAATIVFIIAAIMVDSVGGFIKIYLMGRLEFKSTARLQASVLAKLFRTRMRDLDRYHSADLISRINDSAAAAQAGINNKAIELMGDVMQIIFMLVYLLSLKVSLTIGALVIAFLAPLVFIPFSRRLRKMYEERQAIAANRQAFIQDAVQGAEVVRSFSLAHKMTAGFKQRYGEFLQKHTRILRIEAVGFHLNFAVIIGGLLYVLGFGGYLVVRGQLDVGAVAAFLISFEQLSQPLSRVSNVWTELQTSLAQANRMFEVADLTEENNGVGADTGLEAVDAPLAPADIQFEQVHFGYAADGAKPILNGLSVHIEAGKTTAFAGPSGSGKSTVMSLLLGFYEPDAGRIFYGSTPLEQIAPVRWRNQIAYVSQEPYLFSGSLYENIAWGSEGATEADIVQAAKAAGIHDFIAASPQGYDTRIGERGLTMSGGERQRLSIARAFVRDPQLLLLDEPTAALDSHNEAIVQEALSSLMLGRTTVVIAHRLSTIQDADCIYYMESGAVLEAGSHRELMELDGKYCAMFERNRNVPTREAVLKEALA
jgi:ATP-binding cassette subfamily B protein AbcA/BmrA